MQNQHASPSPLIVGLVSSLTMAHAATWEKLPPLPEPAAGFAAGCVNGKLIVAGGTNWRDGAKRWLDTVWLFDPARNEWSIGSTLPHPVAYAAFGSDGTGLFIAGGADGVHGRKEIYAIDERGAVTRLGEMPQPVAYGGGAIQEGRLSVFGGTPDPDDWSKGGNQLVAITLDKGSTSDVATVKDMPGPIGIPAVVAVGSDLYSFTGAWIDANKQAHNAVEAFRYGGEICQTVASYPEAIRGVFGVPLDDHHIYLAGGYGSEAEGFVAKGFVYDVRTNRYTVAMPLPMALNTTLVKCGEFVYVLGGEDQMKHRSAACWRIRAADLLINP